eukprot:62319-Chlamydomonas_euryale.AAC.4
MPDPVMYTPVRGAAAGFPRRHARLAASALEFTRSIDRWRPPGVVSSEAPPATCTRARGRGLLSCCRNGLRQRQDRCVVEECNAAWVALV